MSSSSILLLTTNQNYELDYGFASIVRGRDGIGIEVHCDMLNGGPMQPMIPRKNKANGPEAEIQKAIIKMLTLKGWYVKSTHGNIYQFGFPDLFACHARYGTRWIEVKNPEKYSFTPAQAEDFPKMCANGAGIWILTAATEEEYAKLFKPFNWYQFLSVFK